ncbi:response regulator receiver [Gemmatirosa kalamazoonensis]|uniref:Response regulator receiver n=1 Tax=Gemmatirosa kalamazoonensis TaxID=861299 RepID=W0RFV2_9BACT|nr:LytTR family DNA-binding domain-containing protein [Gemmatirosa kalamazoonensis]AHG88263.1 response regulator receiver [Gemmatirosa kalamazoonensis]
MIAPLRVMVVDDEPTARQRIVRLLGEMTDVAVVAECGSGREALAAAAARRPDVVFLDIAMPGLDGLDVARRLGTPDARPVVVFVTAYDEHALAAFRVHAADYVLKPVDRERMRDAVEHARRSARPDPGPRFAVRDGRRAHFVPIADILWVESFGNYARLHTTAARFIHRATMEGIAEQLAPHGFVRIHRTAIVNGARVVRLRPAGSGQYEALLDTGLRLRVSRTFRHALGALRR